MSKDVLEAILHSAKGFVERLNFTLFGETFLHPEVVTFISQAKGNGFFVEASTNALLLAENIIKEIIELKINRLHVSLNDLLEDFGPQGREVLIQRLVANVNLVRHKKMINGSRLPEIMIVKIKSHTSFDRKIGEFIENNFKGTKVRTLDFCNWTIFPSGNEASKNSVCLMPWMMMSVDWDGEITLCCDDCLMTNSVGNIREISLREAWLSKKASDLRESLLSKNETRLMKYSCKSCVQTQGHNFLRKFLRAVPFEVLNPLKD